MNLSDYSVKQLFEIDGCTRCGECMHWCSVFNVVNERLAIPVDRICGLRSVIQKEHGLIGKLFGGKSRQSSLEFLAESSYHCTLCGRCKVVCPVGIELRELWISMRNSFVKEGLAPASVDQMKDATLDTHNVLNYPNEERVIWAEFLDGVPDNFYQKEKADVLYFVGCISSFSPAVQSIPEAVLRILERAEIDFTLLGEKEWCCGFPLIVGGLKEEAEQLKKHNLEMVKSLGVKKIVFNCPSCYYTWKHEYDIQGVELLHLTEFIHRLIKQRKIKINKFNGVVTYHDPCDLGRGCGVYETPREVIRSISGLSLVELSQNRERGYCCGGGGDYEMIDAKLVEKVAANLVSFIDKTRADIVITACQQCKRMLLNGVKAAGSKVGVKDISELVYELLG